MRWAFILIVGAALGAALWFYLSEDRRPKVAVPAGTIVFLGDSLTEGHGLQPQEAYPALVKIDGMTMLNMGLSGDQTIGGLKRLKDYFQGGGHPSLVVVALGANDIVRDVTPEDMEANLNSIIQECRNRSIPVLLCGVRIPGKLWSDPIYKSVARKNDVPLMRDIMQGDYFHRRHIQEDDVHPDADGQKIMAEAMQATLLRYFTFGSTETSR